MSRARSILAYGGFDGVVLRPLFHGEEGVYPQFAVAAQGYELVDSTGQTFLDWSNGWGPVILGYRHPEVEEAIRRQLAAGPTLSLMHPIEVEVASKLVDMIPCAEMVAFGKNGSDVINAAVRVARAVSGRDLILQHGFHGFHEWYTCQHPAVKGIPAVMRTLVDSFPYNDLDALAELCRKHAGRLAGIVMEPTNLTLPEPGYLEGVKALAHEHGALLIFDEIITGFRLAPGGAQERFGVVPDLACVGKALANGMPLSAIVGRREYMQVLPSVGYGLTFRGETLSLAAANAVLDVFRREPVTEHLARVGEEVRTRFRELCASNGVRCELSGPSARMSFVFQPAGGAHPDELRDAFLRECLKVGLLSNGTLLPSYAMDAVGVRRTLAALDAALARLPGANGRDRVQGARPTGGAPFAPPEPVSTGFIDWMEEVDGVLTIGGWMLVGGHAPDAVELVSTSGDVRTAERRARPDIAQAFPNQPDAVNAGYLVALPSENFGRDGEFEFTVVARRGGEVAFRCHVVRHAAARAAVSGPFWTGDGILYI